MKSIKVKIEREESRTSDYDVKVEDGTTVLNVLQKIYREQDPTLVFRFSCSNGLCATCTMMINGKPGLSCMTMVSTDGTGSLRLAPLPKGETVKDLMKEV